MKVVSTEKAPAAIGPYSQARIDGKRVINELKSKGFKITIN